MGSAYSTIAQLDTLRGILVISGMEAEIKAMHLNSVLKCIFPSLCLFSSIIKSRMSVLICDRSGIVIRQYYNLQQSEVNFMKLAAI